ncbi:MAG: DUF11 domain-containing protein, partial [Pedosphaera parvula]|nr:DUF11 domain-containing protein [Pedosphaera parvula]
MDDDTLADLALLISRSSATEWNGTNYVGHEVTYAITVTNSGPFSATNVVITNVFSTGVVFVSATNSQGTFVSVGNSFAFNLGVVASNASATAALVISPTNTAGLTNWVGVYGIQPDTSLANNVTSLVSAVAVPFVSLTNNAVVTVTAESIMPANGAIDPGETVTLSLNLQNLGNVSTTNLVVTLAATNGVTPLTATQTYAAVPAGGSVARDFEFQAGSGGNIPLVFRLMDDASSLGVVATNFTTGSTGTFTNAADLTVPDQGPATPGYPSTLTVSNLAGVVNKVTVTLSNISHTFPSDLDILLVAPNGANVMLMSDVSVGDNPLSNVTLTLDDAAAAILPEFAQITPGSYQPTNYGTNDVFTNG